MIIFKRYRRSEKTVNKRTGVSHKGMMRKAVRAEGGDDDGRKQATRHERIRGMKRGRMIMTRMMIDRW
jgi:hypothetical protein